MTARVPFANPQPLPAVAESRAGTALRAEGAHAIARTLPEETAVALVYDGTTQAVMMATPADLEDFALGFSLSEGIVACPEEIAALEVVAVREQGIEGVELRMWLAPGRGAALAERRRSMAGPVGCGLCGIDSLAEALRSPVPVARDGGVLAAGEIMAGMAALEAHQPLHDRTRAAHVAAFLAPGAGIVCAREDVGRHNALDKLVGAMARAERGAAGGAVLLSSRISVDLVQKCARLGAPVLVSVSAPTAAAVRMAQECGITLAAFARPGGLDIFSHPERITGGASDVA